MHESWCLHKRQVSPKMHLDREIFSRCWVIHHSIDLSRLVFLARQVRLLFGTYIHESNWILKSLRRLGFSLANSLPFWQFHNSASHWKPETVADALCLAVYSHCSRLLAIR